MKPAMVRLFPGRVYPPASLLLMLFSLAGLWTVGAVPVTFQVDMDFQIQKGAFKPATDQVEARGAFNDWSAGFVLTNNPANTTIYQGTLEITRFNPNSLVDYKFVVNGSQWEEVSAGDSMNRTFTLSTNALVLPVVHFSDEWIGTPIPVSFQVNMVAPIRNQSFNPAKHVLEVRGTFSAKRPWRGGFVLTNSPSVPELYEGTFRVALPPNSRVAYKFAIREEADVTWETTPNRFFTLSTNAQTLPVEFFSDER